MQNLCDFIKKKLKIYSLRTSRLALLFVFPGNKNLLLSQISDNLSVINMAGNNNSKTSLFMEKLKTVF